MKIAVTTDVHADLAEEGAPAMLRELGGRIRAHRPDVLIIAGDLVGLNKAWIAPALRKLSSRGSLQLIVPGNHDLWLPGGDSLWYYRQRLPELYADCGFHMLDAGPKVLGDVAFVGNLGWYDYSFRDPKLRLPDGSSYASKRWQGLPVWMDGAFVNLKMSDEAFNTVLLSELQKQIESVPARVKTIVAVTHHIAFEEMVIRKKDEPEWSFCNAFLGSRALGELLLKYPRVRYHFCGHTHERHRVRKGRLTSINVGSTYEHKRIEVLSF